MIAEKVVLTALQTLAPVWYGAAPQPDADQPPPLPCIILNRVGSLWSNEFNGADLNLSRVTLQLDYYALTAEGSRRLADAGRREISLLDAPHLLQSETTFYDDGSRAWRVMQSWLAADYAPALEPAGP